MGHHEDGVNYNSVFVITNGSIIHRYDKWLLPNYGVFDDKRYFTPGTEACVFVCRGIKVGIVICEDIWNSGPAMATKSLGADILCVLNASPYSLNKHEERIVELGNLVLQELNLPIVYVNQCGGQDELVFDGASFVMNSNAEVVAQLPAFSEKLAYVDCSLSQHSWEFKANCYVDYPAPLVGIYQALVMAVGDYINKNGFKGVVIGLSGGIDSALTLAIAVDALGSERVMAVMMPSCYTSDISLTDARDMAGRLNVRYEEIAINTIFTQFNDALQGVFAGLAADTTEENLQARIRGTLLMAISNKLGYLVLTTGNKSEMATGYATLYGDMAGGFAVLKDVFKTQVYQLSYWRNSVSSIIPERIITRAPSAELRLNQTDQDSLPDYDTLDKILNLLIEESFSSEEIIDCGFNREQVVQVAHLLKINEYKRNQAPLGPKISKIGFTKDWRYPITNKFAY